MMTDLQSKALFTFLFILKIGKIYIQLMARNFKCIFHILREGTRCAEKLQDAEVPSRKINITTKIFFSESPES